MNSVMIDYTKYTDEPPTLPPPPLVVKNAEKNDEMKDILVQILQIMFKLKKQRGLGTYDFSMKLSNFYSRRLMFSYLELFS